MLVWIDLETEGLDPKKHAILEFAMVVTTDDLVEQFATESLVRPRLWGTYELDPFIVQMHGRNGLLSEHESVVAPSADEVAQHAIGALHVLGLTGENRAQLAGSTISFDRAFLKQYMPALESALHYRNVDVSTVNELARRWYPSAYDSRPGANAKGSHRALADVRDSIEVLRYYRAEWLVVP